MSLDFALCPQGRTVLVFTASNKQISERRRDGDKIDKYYSIFFLKIEAAATQRNKTV